MNNKQDTIPALFPRDEYIYKIFKMRMSDKEMSNVMYWVIICKAAITKTFGVGIYNIDKKNNRYNYVDCLLHIHPEMIEMFTKETGLCLKDPARISLRESSEIDI